MFAMRSKELEAPLALGSLIVDLGVLSSHLKSHDE